MGLELVRPCADLRDAWLEAHREWGPGLHEDGFGIGETDEVDSPDGFAAWLDALVRDPGEFWWIVEDGSVLGGIALRAPEDPSVVRNGHVGYGVRPSARGRGIASWALARVVDHARRAGIAPVTAVCLDHNAASVATLEHAGFTLVRRERHGVVPVRRYELG
jgi:predicted acetyltransferase